MSWSVVRPHDRHDPPYDELRQRAKMVESPWDVPTSTIVSACFCKISICSNSATEGWTALTVRASVVLPAWRGIQLPQILEHCAGF